MERPKVSVIVPIYGVEKYIERCVRSLFEQTLDSLEYVFVNDCTPDRSMEILMRVLEDYPHRKPQVKIIDMPVNSKQAAARTAGMKAATGEYQIHCDPDDWVELDAYKILYDKAIETNADIVTCRLRVCGNFLDQIIGNIYNGDGINCLITLDYDTSLCNKLVKSSIITENNIFPYPEINCGEDMNVVFRMLYFSKRIIGLPDVFYNYNYESENSITNKSKKLLIENYVIKNCNILDRFSVDNNPESLTQALSYLKIRIKNSFLWPYKGDRKRDINYWCGLFPETRNDLLSFPNFNLFQRVFFYLFANCPAIINVYFNYLDIRANKK